MKRFLFLLPLLFLIGCGYLPSKRIADSILSNNIFVDVEMSKTDPQNTVAIKDSVRKGIVRRLNKKLSSRETADATIITKINYLNFIELTYDMNGYVTSYRAELGLTFITKLKDGSSFVTNTVGDHDFRVVRYNKKVRDVNSIISDKDRYNAIEDASKQAFDEYLSVLAIKGFKFNETKGISKQ